MQRGSGARSNDDDFAAWLRDTAEELKHGDLPPESWERGRSPLEDSSAQRRIASLIASIAEKPRERQPEKSRSKRR